jgi:hypothetical protein
MTLLLLIILYIKLKWFCFVFVCLFVPYTNLHFWTNLNQTLHTSFPSSGRDRRVCMVPKCLTIFYLFDLLRRQRVQNPGHNMAAGARHSRHSVISVILAGVSVTSRPDSSATALYPWFMQVLDDLWVLVSHHGNDVVADDTCPESSATALYPWVWQVLVWRHENDVAGDTRSYWKCRALWVMHKKTPWSERNACV